MIWLQQEFPWLGRGFVHAVAESYADEFSRALARLGLTVSTMRCGAYDDLHAELGTALSFPEYYGKNWDAFDECVADTTFDSPFALVWRDASGYAAANPKLFAEASYMLTDAFRKLPGVQAILVITGDGDAFGAPADVTVPSAD